MKHGFFLFPAGLTGAALLFLRASIALLLVAVPLATEAGPAWIAFAAIILAIGIGAGFCTRAAALLAIAIATAHGEWVTPLSFLAHGLEAAALIMTGPGALSIDAWRFGRRTIHLPTPGS
ncbi:hypothetical protein [Sphingomonas echinoides]|jgi:hypothetical protein